MAAAVKNPMEFGFVPAGTVQSLRDLGNWKVRADAIERLHQLVLDLPSGVAVLPSLDEFTGFLVRLLADPNFKISLTTLQIWDALLVKVGADARTVIPSVVPTLVRKLGDGKSVVRGEANMTSLGGLFRALPGETIDAIFSTFKSSDLGKGVSAARVKEDALCAVIRAILDKDAFPCQAVHPAELISNLIAAAQAGGEGRDRDAITDLRRVRATAVEALAVAHDRYGKNETWRLIDAAEDFAGGEPCVANLRWELTARFEDPRLPTLSDEGLIEHCPAAGDVLTKLRPEDALRRELETLPASRSTSRTASRGTTTEARKGLGVEEESQRIPREHAANVGSFAAVCGAEIGGFARGVDAVAGWRLGGVRGGRRGFGFRAKFRAGKHLRVGAAPASRGAEHTRTTRGGGEREDAGAVEQRGGRVDACAGVAERRRPGGIGRVVGRGIGTWDGRDAARGHLTHHLGAARRGRGARGDGGDARERRRRRGWVWRFPDQERDGRETFRAEASTGALARQLSQIAGDFPRRVPRAREFPADGDDDASIHRRTSGEGEGGRARRSGFGDLRARGGGSNPVGFRSATPTG